MGENFEKARGFAGSRCGPWTRNSAMDLWESNFDLCLVVKQESATSMTPVAYKLLPWGLSECGCGGAGWSSPVTID